MLCYVGEKHNYVELCQNYKVTNLIEKNILKLKCFFNYLKAKNINCIFSIKCFFQHNIICYMLFYVNYFKIFNIIYKLYYLQSLKL